MTASKKIRDAYDEFGDARNSAALARTRGPASVPSAVPVIFPESYPFSLVAQLPGAGADAGLFSPAQGEAAVVLLALVLSSPKKYLVNFLDSVLDIEVAGVDGREG